MRARGTTRSRVLAGLVAMSCARVASADEERPEATPYRPTVSTPATLSAPGWFEGELGGLAVHARDDQGGPPRRSSVPYTLKYAFIEDWGLRVGGEAFVDARDDDGIHRTGSGDTSLIGKRRFAIDDDSAAGLEVGALLPTARRALHLGSGKPDWSADGIYSIDFAGWHADANLVETRMGVRGQGATRWQGLGTVALSHPLADRWTGEGEVSGTHQRGDAGTAQVLGAVAYAWRRDCVLDLGAARGVNHASPIWQVCAGVTVVLGRIE